MTDDAADAFVHALATDWRTADHLDEADRALCTFAERLTVDPAGVGDGDIEALRRQGFDDDAIHDATQIICYFNYINRLVDGLGIDLEDAVRAWELPDGSETTT